MRSELRSEEDSGEIFQRKGWFFRAQPHKAMLCGNSVEKEDRQSGRGEEF